MKIVPHTIAGVERRFSLLSVADLETITDTIPNPSGEIIDLRGLDKWAKHPRGCEKFLYMAASKVDPGVKDSDVSKWGTIMERTNVASALFVESITTGEETPDPKG